MFIGCRECGRLFCFIFFIFNCWWFFVIDIDIFLFKLFCIRFFDLFLGRVWLRIWWFLLLLFRLGGGGVGRLGVIGEFFDVFDLLFLLFIFVWGSGIKGVGREVKLFDNRLLLLIRFFLFLFFLVIRLWVFVFLFGYVLVVFWKYRCFWKCFFGVLDCIVIRVFELEVFSLSNDWIEIEGLIVECELFGVECFSFSRYFIE